MDFSALSWPYPLRARRNTVTVVSARGAVLQHGPEHWPVVGQQLPQTFCQADGEDLFAGDDQRATDGCFGDPTEVADQPQLL